MSKSRTIPSRPFMDDLKRRGFAVIKIGPKAKGFTTYSRKEFYKIALVTGKAKINQANNIQVIDGTYLRFSTPYIPFSSEVLSDTWAGYACYFLEGFLYQDHKTKLMQKSALFRIGITPFVKVNEEENKKITDIFVKMLSEQEQNYLYKDEIIRSYINILIHESLKIDSSTIPKTHQVASIKITANFLDSLENQFPVVSAAHPIEMTTPQCYAHHLAIHVNYLNRMVKTATGKTTSFHIAERLIKEASELLNQTDWQISEIAYALGFNHTNYFSSFFKKHLGITPKEYRK